MCCRPIENGQVKFIAPLWRGDHFRRPSKRPSLPLGSPPRRNARLARYVLAAWERLPAGPNVPVSRWAAAERHRGCRADREVQTAAGGWTADVECDHWSSHPAAPSTIARIRARSSPVSPRQAWTTRRSSARIAARVVVVRSPAGSEVQQIGKTSLDDVRFCRVPCDIFESCIAHSASRDDASF